jgi:hypothetical protein
MPRQTKSARNSSKKSKSIKSRPRKTVRCSSATLPQKSHIVKTMMEMLNTVKLYHWKTHSYAEHKATDELYERLNRNMDKFVEVYLGKDGSRIEKWDKKMDVIQHDTHADFKTSLLVYRDFLIHLTQCFSTSKDSDLLNIRDEILGDINQFLYLFTFK